MSDFIAGGYLLPLALACISAVMAVVSTVTLAVVNHRDRDDSTAGKEA